MSNHIHNEKPTPPTIVRNDVSKVFSEQTFGKLSKNNKGKIFFAPVIDIADENDVKFVGLDEINLSINKNLRKIFADIYTDNVAEDGSFNFAAWEADAADFTAGIQKLSDLEEDIGAYVDEQQAIVASEQFGADNEEGTTLMKRSKELADLIRPLRAKKAQIEAKYKERAAKRKDKEAKSTTKTEVPAGVEA